MIQKRRNELFEQGATKTNVAVTLYREFYARLFDIAGDLVNTDVAELVIRSNSVILRTKSDGILLNCPYGENAAALGKMSVPHNELAEQQAMTQILSHITKGKKSPVFFDIGTNIGWYSILFAKLFPSLCIHSFEPVNATFSQLQNNLELNGLRNNVNIKINNFGLSDTNGEVELHVSPSLLGASSMRCTLNAEDEECQLCNIQTMDFYCKENKVAPDFIKCDVEGAELLVFRGGETIIRQSHPAVMAEMLRKWAKCFNYHPNEIILFFKKMDYNCYAFDGSDFSICDEITDMTEDTNFYFFHPETHRNILAGKDVTRL